MRRTLTATALAGLLALPCAASAQTAQPLAAQLPPDPSPVVAGDWPDPDVTLIDGSYYAVATSGGWAPTFRILRSTDLRGWSIEGSVFRRAPRWTRDSFWAPEMAALPRGGYALFYSAFPRKRPGRTWYCLGVATAPSPLGPWRDLGRPLRCTPRGTIDATPVVDGDELHLVYKEDGNAFGKPTPIVVQRLRADGRKLLGKPRELLRNRPGSWESEVIEAPALIRRGGWWHMLYSGGLCCSSRCGYAVGAARARTLAGPWRRYSGNPILRSGNGWRCPGHVSIAGRHVAFHAYRSGEGILAGRQLHLAPLSFRRDGWPAIGKGRPLRPTAGATPTAFDDLFPGPSLAAEWEWPILRTPSVRAAAGLRLVAPANSGSRLDGAVLARRLGTSRYTATAVVDRAQLSGTEGAGLAVVRGGPFALGQQAIGIAVGASGGPGSSGGGAGGDTATIWQRGRGGFKPLATLPVPPTAVSTAHLRIEADKRNYRFAVSADGLTWTRSRAIRGPVEETARIGLTVGGQARASGRFTRATLVER